ncbi:MAG: glycosyltransferase family 4 protein, partial [Kiritimatiellae bacterium]|nr:glycosyltransferase family 4 protein [Kiritimatiellia bacterium]
GPPALALLRAAAVAVRESRRRGERFDILFSANDANGVALPLRIALALKAARRLIVFAHKLPYPYFLKLLAPKAHRIVCVSAAVARGFDEAGFGGRTIVQYGVVNAGAWHPAAEEPPADGEEKRSGLRFCVFGSLDSEWKGADTALKAWRLLPEAFRAENELHLVAYSKAPDFSGETGVVAHGWQSGADAPALLRSMDAVLTPSRDPKRLMETFSQAVVQSMLTALPVIHTPIPVFKEKFDDGGGIEASTPQEFAAAMQALAGDPALRRRLGTEGRRTALQRYIWLFGAFERSVLDPAAAHGAD